MRKLSRDWAGQRRVRDALSKKLEGMVGAKGRRVNSLK